MSDTVYVASLEDSEGCGFTQISVHHSEAGATAALKTMVLTEYGLEGDSDSSGRAYSDYDADELIELLEDEHGHSAGVERHEVQS